MSIQQIFEGLPQGIYLFRDQHAEYDVLKSALEDCPNYIPEEYKWDYRIKNLQKGTEVNIYHDGEKYMFVVGVGGFAVDGEFKWEWIQDLELIK